MQFLHKRIHLNQGDVVKVDCSHQCNIMLLTDSDFHKYRNGGQFNYYGGFYKALPARISAPHSGYWNVTLDIGGGSANIRHSISVIPA
ncbi:hypothetical protein Xmau_03582 [Xenorhabdus mauleonii]|uniref:DUF1883 domain-containing protein n=1 Tax=Xenorhabdus mauleonii TaxID=351675 RepID=A0A1I3X1Q8_9GAMM|nr:DUF1883 domain-containing protein [Xenorhabdus mauleonii]PHM38195.1 hypothetical protein Xmau_03582 [Xenorhabdus mauleonii]SFK13732.1 protein of unknown function [Xenorhabdus mauleonii]